MSAFILMTMALIATTGANNADMGGADTYGLEDASVDGGKVVEYDERSIFVNGTRKLILAGTVHYARIMPEDWSRVFALAKELGLNTIQTYFMWNFHEHKRGNWTWSGRRDLKKFIQTADEHGLYVNVRIGPYVCGEYYFGGIPVWLRAVDDVQCFRCSDPVWKREMARVVQTVVEYLNPLLAQNGGNVIMLQVENEYNGPDVPYLKWAVDMANNATSEVPWNLCHDHALCAEMNNGGDQIKALCTINGFWMDEYTSNPAQPSPKWIMDNRDANAHKIPTIWTEDQGWFDEWGKAKRVRTSRDQLYGIARFISYGGSWHSFYMLTGGNNYGRQSGGEVVTAYAPDTVLSNFLLRHRGRWECYKGFFNLMNEISSHLLASATIPDTKPLSPADGRVMENKPNYFASLLPCTDTDPAHPGQLDNSQKWSTENSTLSVTASSGDKLCLDVQQAGFGPVPLVKCDGSLNQKFQYDMKSERFVSSTKVKCVSPKNKGHKCTVCLDHAQNSETITLWDCKSAGDPQEENQKWQPYDVKKEDGIRPKAQNICLTAASALGPGTLEVVEFNDTVAFLSNTASEGYYQGPEQGSATVSYRGTNYTLGPHSVTIVQILPSGTGGNILYDTSKGACADSQYESAEDRPLGGMGPRMLESTYAAGNDWQYFSEQAADVNCKYNRTAKGLMEQLNLTDNDSDYLWYVLTDLHGIPSGFTLADIKITTISDTLAYPYLLTSTGELAESSNLSEPRETTQVAILACAMGLSNGGVGPHSTKGLSNVQISGISVTDRVWTERWVMRGEDLQIYTAAGKDRVKWTSMGNQSVQSNRPHTWFGAHLPSPIVPAYTAELGPQYSVALDLSGMWKGVAYVNGFNIGRYWQEIGKCTGACAPPIKNGHCYMHWKDCGKPTQTLYHVPSSVLAPNGGQNWVVLFEEAAAPTSGNQLHRNVSSVRFVLLTDA